MKYTTGDIVHVNDIVRVQIPNSVHHKSLAIINKIDNNCLYCTSIVNGMPLCFTVEECILCYRNDKDSILYWRRIIDTNVENFINKYRDIKYIRDNWFNDPFIKNNITAKTIFNKAKYRTLNDVQAQNELLWIEPILDIIIAYGDYEFCKKYYKAYIDIKVSDEIFNNLFAAIWNC